MTVVALPNPTTAPMTGAAEAPTAREAALPLPAGLIDGGEVIILAVKPSLWRTVFDSAPWLVWVGLLATVIAAFGLSVPGLSTPATIQTVVLVGLARLGIALIRWIPVWHVLTSRRVIDISGVRTPRIRSAQLVEIRNTYLRHTPQERLVRVGSILFVSNRQECPPWAWRSIRCAEEVHTKVRRAIENAIDQQTHAI